jgi:hypothetical protein
VPGDGVMAAAAGDDGMTRVGNVIRGLVEGTVPSPNGGVAADIAGVPSIISLSIGNSHELGGGDDVNIRLSLSVQSVPGLVASDEPTDVPKYDVLA